MWNSIVTFVSKKYKRDHQILPQLPIDVIIMIAEKYCEIAPSNGIKMWGITKKFHESFNLQRYYFIAKRLSLQKFMEENYSLKSFRSQIKNLKVNIINTDEWEYNYYNILASEPGLGYLESTDSVKAYIFDERTKINIKNDIYNFDEPFVTIKYREVSNEIKVSKIIWKNGYLFPSIEIYRRCYSIIGS